MNPLNNIDPLALGQRLTEARKARGITQGTAADHLGLSRPTFIAIEKGSRPLKPDEIVKLASFYGRTVHEIVRPGEPVTDLQPHLRAVVGKSHPQEAELDRAIGELQGLADDYRELERIMSAPLRQACPPEIPLNSRISPKQMGDAAAVQERLRLGLGDQPVLQMRCILEMDVGLRIFFGGLPSSVAGMYAFVSELGGCVFINRRHPPERQRASMLHEYGHLLVDRHTPGIDYLQHPVRKPANEQFAEAFAMSFLMPGSSLKRHFNQIVSTSGDFQVADLCRLSHFYFVSVEAMTHRLENLGLISNGTYEHLKESGFSVRKAATMLDLPSRTEPSDCYPQRYKYLAVQAFEQAKISQGQLARFLRCDPVTAREILTACLTSDVENDDGLPETRQLDFQQSLFGVES